MVGWHTVASSCWLVRTRYNSNYTSYQALWIEMGIPFNDQQKHTALRWPESSREVERKRERERATQLAVRGSNSSISTAFPYSIAFSILVIVVLDRRDLKRIKEESFERIDGWGQIYTHLAILCPPRGRSAQEQALFIYKKWRRSIFISTLRTITVPVPCIDTVHNT